MINSRAARLALRRSATAPAVTPRVLPSLTSRLPSQSPPPSWSRQHNQQFRQSSSTAPRLAVSNPSNPIHPENPHPTFSANVRDPAAVTEALLALTTRSTNPWAILPSGAAIQRIFRFDHFKSAWYFIDSVAKAANVNRHHPEWSNMGNRVFVRWTTHDPPGLSEKDVEMAATCDQIAKREEFSYEHKSSSPSADDFDPSELEIKGSTMRVWKREKGETIFTANPSIGLHNLRPSVDSVNPVYKGEFKDDRTMEGTETDYATDIMAKEKGYERARAIWEQTNKARVWSDDMMKIHPDERLPDDVSQMRGHAQGEADAAAAAEIQKGEGGRSARELGWK